MELVNFASTLISREMLLELADVLGAEGLRAHDHTKDLGLSKRRKRALEGTTRFHFFEEAFEKISETYGGDRVYNLNFGSDIKIYQPFYRFGGAEERGIVLGLAMMPEPNKLPAKNKSRASGVLLNYSLTPSLNLDGHGGNINDIFVLFLVARNPHKPGHILEMAVGVIDASYEMFLDYASVSELLSAYDDIKREVVTEAPDISLKSSLKLKTGTSYRPPEFADQSKEAEG